MYQIKSKTKRFVAGAIFLTLALVVGVGASTANAAALTSAQVSAIISLLQSFGADSATISNVQASLTGGTPSAPASTGSYTFSTDLTVGSKGADVMNLQKVLNMSSDTQVASGASAGAPGYETSTFGPATKAAVIKWQKKMGISATGYVGPLTRAKLNGSSSTSTTTTTPVIPAGTGLTVSSPAQPAVTIAPYKASRVPFTKVTLTAGNDGDVTVNSLTVQRTGLANDAAFSSIVLLDENGLQIGTSKTFNSNHQTNVGEAFIVPRGTSRTLTVAGNMETSANTLGGQVASLTIVGVNTSATVTGSLPITGSAQTVNETLTLGTATLYVSQYDPASNLTKNIGDTNLKFSGIKITAGSAEDVTLWSVRWNQTGSAGSNDLANIQTVLDGTSYPTIVSADGKYFTTLFPNGVVIQKGFSKDIYIKGDIVGSGSASRTVEFDLYDASDLYISGNTYNFGILGSANSTGTLSASSRSKFTTGSPFYGGSTLTINAGTVTTIAKSTGVAPAANVATNVPNQILGAYDTNIKGEPISVQSTIIHFNSSAAGLGTLTSVSLLDKNGAVVAGPVDAALVTGTDQKATFTDTITYPVGVGTYTIVGKLPTSYTNGSTINASTTPSSDWTTVKGQVSGNTLTLTNAVFSMNTMTVRKAALAVAASNNPAAQVVVAGSQNLTFTNLQLDATQSGEDVRISTLPTHLTYTGGNGNDVSSCRLYDGDNNLTTGSNVVNPDTTATAAPYTFTLDQALIIPKGTIKTLSFKCNVSGAATAFVGHWDVTSTDVSNLTVTGVTSTGSVTPTGSAVGLAMTVGSATLAATGDTSGTAYTVAAAGTAGVTTAAYRLRATNDNINLQRVVLKLTNTASSSSSDITVAHIFDGTTEVGSATFTGGSRMATSTLSTPVLLSRDTDKILTVKTDLGPISNSSAVTTSGHLINLDIDTDDIAGTYGTGVGSGVRVNSTGTTTIASTGVKVFKSYPTIAPGVLTSGGVSANLPLLRFTVTANSKGPVNIYKFLLSFSTSSVTVSGVNIFAFTSSDYSSSPLSGVNSGGQLMQSGVSTATFSPTSLPIYPQTNTGASTTIQVAAGSTMYFEVRASTVTTSGNTFSVGTTLKGDTSYPVVGSTVFMASTTNLDSSTNSALNSFIWSPNSTTTPINTDNDWTNGFALPGLPSNGITQSHSNAG